MSTLEKAVTLMKTMPDSKIETIYAFIRFMDAEPEQEPATHQPETKVVTASAFGIAHKYANPELIQQEEGAFERAMVEKHALN